MDRWLKCGQQTVTLFLVFCLTTANVAGQTKRYSHCLASLIAILMRSPSVAANALISAAFSVGNIIGPQLFKPKDAPQYKPAKIIAFVTALVTATIAAALRVYYGWQNGLKDAAEKKERETGELKDVTNIEWLNCACIYVLCNWSWVSDILCPVTDRENKTFRYRY
jgi:hypothetical protein